MTEYTVSLPPEEEKALLTDIISIQDWLENAIHEKARRCIDRILLEYSNRNPNKMSPSEKGQLLAALSLKTAAERQAELEAESEG